MLRVAAMLFGLLLAFLLGEAGVRIFRIDVYPPVEWVQQKVEEYNADPTTRMIYDEHTGWSPRPGAVTHEGRYQYEGHGIRSRAANEDYSLAPPAGTTRIAIFGDSFAHCDDVPFEQSWGGHLERILNAEGQRSKVAGRRSQVEGRTVGGDSLSPLATHHSTTCQVVNFGVSAYGMDQALLRWRYLGKRFSPKIVVFGFQGENVARNVNLLRGFYVRYTGIPFSKPRFIFEAGRHGDRPLQVDRHGDRPLQVDRHGDRPLQVDRVQAINDPAIPPDAVPGVMANMDDWPLAKYEWFYAPRKARRTWWQRSRLLAVLAERFREQSDADDWDGESVYKPGGEPERVTLQILREFKREVTATGGRFYVVHLPKKSDLQRLLAGRPLVYDRLWQLISKEHDTIDPRDALLAAARQRSLATLFAAPRHVHFSDAANRIIGRKIAKSLQPKRDVHKM